MSQERNDREDRRAFLRKMKHPILLQRGFRCQMCGRFVKDKAELHHVLPYARFERFRYDTRNLLLLCHECHEEIHNNPFLESRMIRRWGSALHADLEGAYGRWAKSHKTKIKDKK